MYYRIFLDSIFLQDSAGSFQLEASSRFHEIQPRSISPKKKLVDHSRGLWRALITMVLLSGASSQAFVRYRVWFS